MCARTAPLEGIGHDVGVQQPDVAHAGIASQLFDGYLGVGAELASDHVVEAQSIAGGLDVALDVDRFFLRLLWFGAEPLDDRRIDRSHDNGHDHPQSTAVTGSTQPRCQMLITSKTADSTEIKSSRLSAGSWALTSVNEAPSTGPREEKLRPNRS